MTTSGQERRLERGRTAAVLLVVLARRFFFCLFRVRSSKYLVIRPSFSLITLGLFKPCSVNPIIHGLDEFRKN